MEIKFLHTNISYLRKKAGLSQRQLGVAVHLSKSAVGHHETARQQPIATTLLRYSELFKVTIDDLLKIDLRAKDAI